MLLQMITSVGFPIVACFAMAMYVKDITKQNREEMCLLNVQHREERKEMTEAVNNNTIVMQKLIDSQMMKERN